MRHFIVNFLSRDFKIGINICYFVSIKNYSNQENDFFKFLFKCKCFAN